MPDTSYSILKTPDRKKRSLRHRRFHFNNFNNDKNQNDNIKINKRFANFTAPTGVYIEKKKIMVHLPNEKRIVPKCSHAPKDSKSHETELKHPFYKHTQRLDELLDQFLDKNLPQIFGDLNFGSILHADDVEHTTRKTVATHKKGHKNVNIISRNDATSTLTDFFKITQSDKSDSEVLLGITTVMSPPKKGPTKSVLERVPNIRKLMQAYEDDEESLGYDDLKEVLTDDVESHDDTEAKVDRNKRSYETEPKPLEFAKSNPPEVQIPNWKGPLPLYPDELNTMFKERKDNRNKPISKDLNQANVMFTDVEYVEDYLTNKYEKLANMAQAYSDYGVLDEKKESKSDIPKSDNTDNRVKLSLGVVPRVNKKLFDGPKKKTTESQRMFYSQHDSKVSLVPNFLKKHIKIIKGTPKTTGHLMDSTNMLEFEKIENENKEMGKFKFDLYKQGVSSIPEKYKYEQKHLRIARSIDNCPTVSLDRNIERKSVKNIGTTSVTSKAEDEFSIEVGMAENLFANENELQADCDQRNNKNTNIFAATTTPSTDTPKINNENIFKHRSLKSIEDQEKVLGIDEDITMDELTTEFIEDLNASNIISIPARNKNDAVIVVDDNFELEGSTRGINTVMSVSIATKHYEADIIDNVSLLNIFENVTREESTIKSNDDSKPNLDKNAQKSILDIVNLANSQNNTRNATDGMDLSDFFRLISMWFSSLASASLDDNDDNSSTVNPIMKLKTSLTPGDSKLIDLNRSDIHYPSYDSDMIDNIGHRSRMLLSVDEPGNVTGKNDVDADLGSGKEEHDKGNTDLQQTNSTIAPENHVLTTTTEERDTSEEDKALADNTTIVKRSIGDSGLVFWSDLYDDEYGIKIDSLEKELAGKNVNKGKEFMKRSKNWFQDKVRSLTDNIKGFRNEGDKSNTNDENNRNPKSSHVFKRQADLDKSYNAEGKVPNFAELTVKMRNVVKEAAKAVQQTRKMQVRENKDEFVANGIMQQLVRMMSDLVNFQVQQKTCVKLPRDLKNFLEWITTPNQDHQSSRQIDLQDNRLDDTKTFEKDKDTDPPLMIQDKTESLERSLETLHVVEDLIQQYDQMDDEDKSKMSGVRKYLENQQEFLNKHLSLMDEFAFSNIYTNQPQSRFRRHVTTQKTSQLNRNKLKRRIKRRLRDFLKKFGKKHTTKKTSSPNHAEATEVSRSHDRKNDLDKKSQTNNKKNVKVIKPDISNRKQDDKIENKIYESNAIQRQDSTKSDRYEYDIFNYKIDNNEESKKVIPKNYNLYGNSDGFEQNYNSYTNINKRQDSYNQDDNIKGNDKVRRNLQDVYYRALHEAKKVTTAKNIDKPDSSLRTL